ncbi:hypothetical protein IQ255_15870 [Pleurocapsales cyanobacterium LEGE 10410]|nr:hypothetical protein [Pleurocapsales cyanobacterium LEGE 10410]
MQHHRAKPSAKFCSCKIQAIQIVSNCFLAIAIAKIADISLNYRALCFTESGCLASCHTTKKLA